MPAELRERCEVALLPPSPTNADGEMTLALRGLQIGDCDAKRQAAVDVFDAQLRALDAQEEGRAYRARPWWKVWAATPREMPR